MWVTPGLDPGVDEAFQLGETQYGWPNVQPGHDTEQWHCCDKPENYIMPRWLKRGMDAGAIKAADAKVRETVEASSPQVEASARTRRCATCRRNSTNGRRPTFG